MSLEETWVWIHWPPFLKAPFLKPDNSSHTWSFHERYNDQHMYGATSGPKGFIIKKKLFRQGDTIAGGRGNSLPTRPQSKGMTHVKVEATFCPTGKTADFSASPAVEMEGASQISVLHISRWRVSKCGDSWTKQSFLGLLSFAIKQPLAEFKKNVIVVWLVNNFFQ